MFAFGPKVTTMIFGEKMAIALVGWFGPTSSLFFNMIIVKPCEVKAAILIVTFVGTFSKTSNIKMFGLADITRCHKFNIGCVTF